MVLSSGVWEELRKIKDPLLQQLVLKLKDTIMHSRADSTIEKYTRAFLRWVQWAESRDSFGKLPVNPLHFALYLQHLGSLTQSRSAVEEATNAVSWFSQTAGYTSISQDPFVKMALAGLQRSLSKPRRKKEPVSPVMLKEMVDSLDQDPSLSDVRAVAIAFIAFYGFLRFDEVVKLRCCDVRFLSDHMVIKIVSSKTDQYRQGDEVVIARSGSSLCPVGRLELYCRMARVDSQSAECLFRGIVKSKNGERLRSLGSLSYSRIREILMGKIKALGYDPADYGTHSFRSGGASLAANRGVPDRLFKKHGRWKSESAKDGYIKDSLSARLDVSRKLLF
ncbi:PREDICTED: uncharacterized protein LOC109581484 isoform X2 [Amphimedon queenslandica]|uniref:Tyr recombinase domain-containing protein n=1 Tax=Amphimedon queenslandica TaxID=400682 RepID=A0A1X7V0D2_AMPQE|nr:PREDICTED: uncharacterized protein LOC109581484 isoform X2 [Amphimedon queenslandica]|eukprot:XP_019851172.1 PREDICTED: uncharacterized protein LOC109581484 isoform X2 [Amphimedon queenslandica]